MQISKFIKTDEALNYLTNQGMDASDPNFEKNVIIYRAAAYKKICNFLGYSVVEDDYTNEYRSGSGMKKLFLINRPINSISTVIMDGADITSALTIIDEDYLWYEDGFFTQDENNIRVSYNAGWSQTTLPSDIRLAGLKLIALYSGETGGAGTTLGKSSVSDGQGGTETMDPDAEMRIVRSLASYQAYDRF